MRISDWRADVCSADLPFLGTLMAARALALVGDHEALMGEVLTGSAMLAFAHEEPTSRYDLTSIRTSAKIDGTEWILTGTRAVVAHVEGADQVLRSAEQTSELQSTKRKSYAGLDFHKN